MTPRCPRCVRLPPMHLFNTPFTRQGFLGRLRLVLGLLGLRPLVWRRRVPLVPLALLRNSLRPHILLASMASRRRGARVKLPFPHPLEAAAAPGVREEGPGRRQPVGLSLPLRFPLNIQPVVVVRGLKRQQASALTNFVGCFLPALSYFFFLLFLTALNDLNNIFHSL